LDGKLMGFHLSKRVEIDFNIYSLHPHMFVVFDFYVNFDHLFYLIN
jgi:hypothetical protein